MILPYHIKKTISDDGFAIIESVFTNEEIEHLLNIISLADTTNPTFKKATDLFAIRQFFKAIPEAISIVFNERFNSLISQIFGDDFFVVKSIYFDKPEQSNWFVAYHQDLTISVDKKIGLDGYGPWTVKNNQFAVQPPLTILENNFTIRIHLDSTDDQNGALKIIPKSHLKKIYRPETIDWALETEKICPVKKGGIMIMRPLLLHASGRTINKKRRRVLHIEFSNQHLVSDLNWAEAIQQKVASDNTVTI